MDKLNSAFTCQRCGHCCEGEGGIVLAAKDVARLAAHLGLSEADFLAKHSVEKLGKHYLKTGADGYCEFFSQGCGVHPARPDICRAWPYFKGNLIDNSSWELAQDYCPGINAQSGHERFAQEGYAYLKDEGLIVSQADGAEALRVEPPLNQAGEKVR